MIILDIFNGIFTIVSGSLTFVACYFAVTTLAYTIWSTIWRLQERYT